MRATQFRAPVANCGGITDMIAKEVKLRWWQAASEHRTRIIVHSYREVGTALEACVEVHVDGPFGLSITMGNIYI